MAKKESQLDPKDIKKMEDDLKKLRKFLKALEKIGVKPPKSLPNVIKALELAIKSGRGIGEAADEASKELKKYQDNLKGVCKELDSTDDRMVCEAKIDRQYMKDGANYVLDPKNPNSVVSKSIDKAIKALTPDMICKHWDRCAKIDKGKK